MLEEIGIQQKDTLLVINKIDALPDRARLDGLLGRYPDAVPISARSGLRAGPNLAAAVSEALSRSFLDVDVEMGVENGRLLAYLAAHGEVFSKQVSRQPGGGPLPDSAAFPRPDSGGGVVVQIAGRQTPAGDSRMAILADNRDSPG